MSEPIVIVVPPGAGPVVIHWQRPFLQATMTQTIRGPVLGDELRREEAPSQLGSYITDRAPDGFRALSDTPFVDAFIEEMRDEITRAHVEADPRD